jgi:hypothetical protein
VFHQFVTNFTRVLLDAVHEYISTYHERPLVQYESSSVDSDGKAWNAVKQIVQFKLGVSLLVSTLETVFVRINPDTWVEDPISCSGSDSYFPLLLTTHSLSPLRRHFKCCDTSCDCSSSSGCGVARTPSISSLHFYAYSRYLSC